MEPQDLRILAELQRNARCTNQELAETVGMSTSACWRRVKALEEAGLIQGYAALVDREKAGFALSAILHVTLQRHEERFVEDFVRRVQQRAEVLECYATTGDADYHLRVVVTDIAAYNHFLDSFLIKLPGVGNVRTNVILKEIKTTVALPLKAVQRGR